MITNLVSSFSLSTFSSNTSFLMKLWPAIVAQIPNLSTLYSQQLFTPTELLGGGFCSHLFASSKVNQLAFHVSFETVLCYNPRIQFSRRLFAPTELLGGSFCLQLFTSFEVTQLNLISVSTAAFHPDRGYFSAILFAAVRLFGGYSAGCLRSFRNVTWLQIPVLCSTLFAQTRITLR